MAAPPSLLIRTRDAALGLLGPWIFMSISASFLPRTIFTLLRDGEYHQLLVPSQLRAAWFTRFWALGGPNARRHAGERVIPLLDGRTSGGRIVDEPTGPGLGGVVMEIGAGSGFWVDLFSDDKFLSPQDETASSTGTARDSGAGGSNSDLTNRHPAAGGTTKPKGARTKITHIYGVEPSASQHPRLRQSIRSAGLDDIYEIVPVGIEDLATRGIEKGSVDCIVSILALCSIPDPERNVAELYSYLRPDGGRWYVYEHVRADYSWYMRLYQRVVNVFWPQFLGGCLLCRQTEKTLRDAGAWQNVNVGSPADEPWHACVPHILGVFTR